MLKLITDRLWVRWFGKTADLQKDTNCDSKYFIVDDDPPMIRHIHPTPDYVDSANNNGWHMTYASFIGGLIHGVLETCMFPAKVNSYCQPESEKPHATWFVVEFEPQVGEKMRRMKTA
jgi:hypothetical protein